MYSFASKPFDGKALTHITTFPRLIDHVKGSTDGPTLIFVAGIHGNEPAGAFALQRVFSHLKNNNIRLKGQCFALAGNLPALKERKRLIDEDLNRLWTEDQFQILKWQDPESDSVEEHEMRELLVKINAILNTEKGPFYIFDLHTTSSKTPPFIILNDSMINRAFARKFPVPKVLGMEEHLVGPMIDHYSEQGYVSIGFEAGQNDDPESIIHHEAFIYLSLLHAGCMEECQLDFNELRKSLQESAKGLKEMYEVFYKHVLKPGDDFILETDFKNFQFISKNQIIATSKDQPVRADRNARIFLPLYQGEGREAFYGIRSISTPALKMSRWMRRKRLDKVLPVLPGISWSNEKRNELVVNKTIARFFVKPVLHLMGYRSQRFDRNYLLIKNREITSRYQSYASAPWIGGL